MKCPGCQVEIAWTDQPSPIVESRAIKDGDNLICVECSTVCVAENGGLREMTAREFLSKSKASRDVIKALYTQSLMRKVAAR